MKKLLTCLATLTITGSSMVPTLATAVQTNSQVQLYNDDKNDDYKVYQAKTDWEKYISKNQLFIKTIKSVGGLGDEYQYKGTDLGLENVKDKNQAIGTLLINGKIHTTIDNSSMASQHVIDNSKNQQSISWSDLIKDKTNSQTFAREISKSLNYSDIQSGLQPLIIVDKIYDLLPPEESQFYDLNIVYIYLPLSFSIDDYSTLITQSKATE